MGCIYLITNIINKKRYVGQTKKTSPEDRYSCLMNIEHGNNNPRMSKDIKECGVHVFDLDVLEFCSEDQLDVREKYWINKLNTRDESCGYNIQHGGGKNIDDNEIIQLYKKHKSVNKVRLLTHHASKYIRKVLEENDIEIISIHDSNRCRFSIDPKRILELYEQTKSIGEVIKSTGGAYQTIYRILDEYGINYTVKKFEGIPVYRIDKNGKQIDFDDVYQAADKIIEEQNLTPKFRCDVVGHIMKCIKGKFKTSYGYKWYKK